VQSHYARGRDDHLEAKDILRIDPVFINWFCPRLSLWLPVRVVRQLVIDRRAFKDCRVRYVTQARGREVSGGDG
jgi:hypothetical protein